MAIIYDSDFHPSIQSPVLISHAFDYCACLNILLGTLLAGADPEILKGGCTECLGPKLPCSRFDPFLNLL